MFERPRSGERALLVHVTRQGQPDPDELGEFRELAASAGARILGLVTGARQTPDPRYFIGRGKAEEIRDRVEAEEAELVIFDHVLTPSQERNLEKLFQCRVLDRNGLILDIFAQRARSFEGKLQVELAQLRHLSTRLVRGWTHLERQKGGIGLRGPGETQLETDRRLLGQRIDQIRRRLAKVESQRDQGRRARRRAEVPTVSLVGYTNAGKSPLFNRLTHAHVYARDQLFATLDPTLRRLVLPEGEEVVLADTVGFISKLPHELVAAFRSTLQETVEAALLLHVVDAASHRRAEQVAEVEEVLGQIGALEVPRIEVFNKIDLLPDTEPRAERNDAGEVVRVWCSAATGAGIDLLLQALQERFHQAHVRCRVHLKAEEGRLRALLHEKGHVLHSRDLENGDCELEVAFTLPGLARLEKQEPELAKRLEEKAGSVPGPA
ncbi:MAG TPA: GTPase HflX [Thiolapillus brandeum]|uniref:GTPase HflX n=1 Tax=Thiolapillus brandeum TaxID=1076588 RepID=A0A7C5MZL4_9GAMM|nr:GTPase HflX [Thiolapillus brandeum]